jgi:diamine N-acetyltransferase
MLSGYTESIMVDKSYQGKGIGKTATALMIEGMIETLNVDKIVVGYHPENKGAHHLFQSGIC